MQNLFDVNKSIASSWNTNYQNDIHQNNSVFISIFQHYQHLHPHNADPSGKSGHCPNRCRQYPSTDTLRVLRHRQHPGRLQGNQTPPRLPTRGLPICLHLLLQHDLQSGQRARYISKHGLVQSSRVRGSVAVWPHIRDCSLSTPIGVWSLLAQRDHRREMLQEKTDRSCLKCISIRSLIAFFKNNLLGTKVAVWTKKKITSV